MNSLDSALAQLRHLYAQMIDSKANGNPAGAARGLLGPAIRDLEHVAASRPAEPAPKVLACPECHFATDVCVHLGSKLDASPSPDDALRRAVEAKDGAYRERDQLVALVARMALALGWRAGLRRHQPDPDPTWDEDWKNVVAIDLPTGQVTWHFHDSERPLFHSLPPYPASWDGHDTAEKYRRVNTALLSSPPESGTGEGATFIECPACHGAERDLRTPPCTACNGTGALARDPEMRVWLCTKDGTAWGGPVCGGCGAEAVEVIEHDDCTATCTRCGTTWDESTGSHMCRAPAPVAASESGTKGGES